MGYELNRLMKQYGISTPTISSYTGQQMPTDKAASDYSQKLAQYEADRAAYDKYVDEYNRRLSGAPMYMQSQFQTKKMDGPPTTVGGLYTSFLGREPDAEGMKYWNEQFGNKAIGPTQIAQFVKSASPEIYDRNLQSKVGQNIYNATGSYYGDQLKYPTFSPLASIASATNSGTSTDQSTSNSSAAVTPGSTNISLTPAEENNYTGGVEFSNGGAVRKFSRGGVNDLGLPKLSEMYGLANPTELPVMEEPIRLASNTTTASDADPEGFPTGSTEEIVARGRAAVAQAKANARAGVQPDPSVYDDEAARREGTTTSTPRTAPTTSRPSLEEMMRKYGANQNQYAEQIRAASERNRAETEAFREMLKKQMTGEGEGGPSKAEMYFRLAAALASPTKTGGVMENVGLAAKELGEYQKDVTAARRQNRARNLELMMKGQELSMRSAKEDLDALRALGAEEGRDRRQIIGEMIKEYIRSGEPESSAGKQAKDEGLTPGTPEYMKRVQELAQTSVDSRLAQINATLEGMRRQDEQAKLAREKFEESKKEKAEAATKLTPKELDMKLEEENTVASLEQALKELDEARQLNAKAFDNSLGDRFQRTVLENTKSNDPKVVATRVLEQKLKSQMIATSAEKMKGVLSDSDIKLLMSVQGLDSKSREERALIIGSAIEALKRGYELKKKRLEDIKTGKFREREPEKKDGEQ